MKRLSVKKMRAPEEARRVTVGFRVDESTRKCLQDAADKNARSLSQEAEHRLMTSFGDEKIVLQALELAYGEDVAAACSLLPTRRDGPHRERARRDERCQSRGIR